MKIGVILSNLQQVPLGEALAAAARIGFSGVQLSIGPFGLPEEIFSSDVARREARLALDKHSLVLTALLDDWYAQGFLNGQNDEARIERTKATIRLAPKLGTSIVTGHLVPVPEDPSDDAFRRMRRAYEDVARSAERLGAVYALETWLEPPDVLAAFLTAIALDGLRVNLDPANLLTEGLDPVQATAILSRWVAHVHCKDAVALPYGKGQDPERALGHGTVDWPGVLATLGKAGYDGWFVLERETGDRMADLHEGCRLLQTMLRYPNGKPVRAS